MTMLDSLTEPQQKMIRTIVAGKPNYTQRQALATLGALERQGYIIEVDGKHSATDAGIALVEEDALRHQHASDFHVGQNVEYSNWLPCNHKLCHEWTRAVVKSVNVRVGLTLPSGEFIAVTPQKVRAAKQEQS